MKNKLMTSVLATTMFGAFAIFGGSPGKNLKKTFSTQKKRTQPVQNDFSDDPYDLFI